MCVTGFFQCAPDKSDVVGSTASASGLGDDDGQAVGVIFSGEDRIHDLTDDDQRWVAGVVVDIL